MEGVGLPRRPDKIGAPRKDRVGNVIGQGIGMTDKECVRLPRRLRSAYSHHHSRLAKTGKNNHKEHVEVYYFVATIYKNVLVISNWEVIRSSRRFLRQAT